MHHNYGGLKYSQMWYNTNGVAGTGRHSLFALHFLTHPYHFNNNKPKTLQSYSPAPLWQHAAHPEHYQFLYTRKQSKHCGTHTQEPLPMLIYLRATPTHMLHICIRSPITPHPCFSSPQPKAQGRGPNHPIPNTICFVHTQPRRCFPHLARLTATPASCIHASYTSSHTYTLHT